MTLHNGLEEKVSSIVTAVPDSSLTRLQHEWHDVSVLVIDKISFLSPETLYKISARLGNMFPCKKHIHFSGLYVIMAGDPYQLGPVGGKTLWPGKHERELSVEELVGRDY